MTHWITSDIHLNHANILQYCGGRGSTVPEMNEKIISNWNSVVKPGDLVTIVGDVAMGIIKEAPALIRSLNGSKHLVKGNHDHGLCRLPEIDSLFDSIRDYKEITHSKDGIKHKIVLCHFPLYSWVGQHYGVMHCHGHLHSPPDKVHLFPERRILDVGLDGNNLFPRKLDDVVDLLSRIKISKNHHDRD